MTQQHTHASFLQSKFLIRIVTAAFILPMVSACPMSKTPPDELCAPDESITLTDTDQLPGWGTSIAEHPLMTGEVFTGTLTYSNDGSTTEATITTSYRDVVIVAASNSQDPEYECPLAEVSFSMDMTLKTADGAFDETLVADLYTPTWITDGVLEPAAVNDAIEGPYKENYVDDPRGPGSTDLRLVHNPAEPLPASGNLSVSFAVPEGEMGIGELVGEISFE